MHFGVDISENDILSLGDDILEELLKDHTTRSNIFWATSDYEPLGAGYAFNDPILPHLITGNNNKVVMPRVLKSREEQRNRSKGMAEVFTPSWVCNAQNNLVDEAWFKRRDVFNLEYTDKQGKHLWKPTTEKILFPDGKTWRDYVHDTRLEITCGEAPYLVSRYDTTTGEFIPIERRIGMLDRKLRVVSENCDNSGEWLEMAQEAFKNTYGYEWQGDNLLLAREALLYTFIEYYVDKFGKMPQSRSIKYIAYIISWNLWQMDGLKMVVPCSCDNVFQASDLFNPDPIKQECPACKSGDYKGHIGIKCLIRDWRKPREKQKIPFITLIK